MLPRSESPQLLNHRSKLVLRRQREIRQKMMHHHGVTILPSGPLEAEDKMSEYMPLSDFVYYTGLEDPNTIAVFTKSRYILFWTEVSDTHRLWYGDKWTIAWAKSYTNAAEVYPYSTFEEKLPDLLRGSEILYYPVGHDDALFQKINKIRVAEKQKLNVYQRMPNEIHDFSNISIVDRVTKYGSEIKLMRYSAAITMTAFERIMCRETTWENSYEYALESILSWQYRKYGAKHAFPPIVASGSNATTLHYIENDSYIHRNSLVLVDSGARYGNYCADITRTFPVSGKFTKAQQRIYEAVLNAQEKAIEYVRPGKAVGTFHAVAIRELSQSLHDLKIIKESVDTIIEEKLYKKYYPHNTGHWIGMEVHDPMGSYYDYSKRRLFRIGMVVTVEPGLYFPVNDLHVPQEYRGMGIRIEDMVLVTHRGNDVMTSKLPRKVDDLIKFMNKRVTNA